MRNEAEKIARLREFVRGLGTLETIELLAFALNVEANAAVAARLPVAVINAAVQHGVDHAHRHIQAEPSTPPPSRAIH